MGKGEIQFPGADFSADLAEQFQLFGPATAYSAADTEPRKFQESPTTGIQREAVSGAAGDLQILFCSTNAA